MHLGLPFLISFIFSSLMHSCFHFLFSCLFIFCDFQLLTTFPCMITNYFQAALLSMHFDLQVTPPFPVVLAACPIIQFEVTPSRLLIQVCGLWIVISNGKDFSHHLLQAIKSHYHLNTKHLWSSKSWGSNTWLTGKVEKA